MARPLESYPVPVLPDWTREWRPEAVRALVTAAVVALFGAPVGLLWAAVAPRALVVMTTSGADLADAETKAFIGADGTFLIVTGGAGVLCGVLGYLWRRRTGPGLAVGLAGGGLAAAAIAAAVGRRLFHHSFEQAVARAHVGTQLQAYVTLRADGLLMAWPVVALLVFVLLVAIFERETEIGISWAGR